MNKWNEIYGQSDAKSAPPPASTLVKFLDRLPGGKALDLACGLGRNAIFLAGRGYEVDAVDSSERAIQKGRIFALKAGVKVNFICADLTTFDMSPEEYDLIICYYYLERSIFPAMVKGLKKGGVVLCETYTKKQKSIGPPFNEDYLLGVNELPRLFKELRPELYREGIINDKGRKKGIATLIGRRIG